MRTEFFWILPFCGFAAISLACGLLAWPHLSAVWPGIQEQIDRFHRLHPLAKVTLLVFIAGFIAYGSTKTNQVDQTSGTNIVEIVEGGTNDVEIVEGGTNGVEIVDGGETNAPSMMLMMTMPFFDDEPPTVTPEDIARGWQLLEVRTNFNISYTMPEGATLATNWWMRGAYEDVKSFDFGNWRFPFGSNSYSSAWAFAWGKVRFALADTNTEIVVVGAPMSAVPYRSRLWSAADTNDSRLVTWENFSLNRDTNTPVNAQIELLTTGDIVTRSNAVEKVYRRVDPDDWDDDGWENGDDPDPYVGEEFCDYFYQELPEGANEAAYCWIEIRPRWNSDIWFYGDAPSNLDDPYIYGKAGETYRVQLLIGKTYTIVSSQPVDVVGQSSSSIEIDGNGTREIEVVWPVRFSALEGNGSGFMMRVVPSGLGGTFTWTQHCCTITGYGNQFWWAHERYCFCGGCYASGFYSYEGYEKECTGGHCGCPYYDDDDPYESEEEDGPYAAGASVEFSESVVIFEDTYTNMPGEVVARQSTRTTLTCIAHGGETGGTATFSIENGDKLVSCSGGSLPVTRFVPPLQKVEFEIVYEGKLPSGSEEDIIAKADFTERVSGTRHSTVEDELTSVKVELEADKTAPANSDSRRHVYGIAEDVHYRSYPNDVFVEWTFPLDFIERGGSVIMCPWIVTNGSFAAFVRACGVSYSCSMMVVEPEIEVRNLRVNQNTADVSPVAGQAGHLLMYMDMYALPDYVSFCDIEIREIPDESQSCFHCGYFDDRSKGGNWSHTQNDGAGSWNEVGYSGFYGTDKAGHRGRYQEPWSDGWKEWAIPMDWGVSGISQGQFRQNPTTQKFTLSSDGDFEIKKFNHTASRSVQGVILLDGVSVW